MRRDDPQLIGMRHSIVHGHRPASFKTVWAVVHEDLPVLRTSLEGTFLS